MQYIKKPKEISGIQWNIKLNIKRWLTGALWHEYIMFVINIFPFDSFDPYLHFGYSFYHTNSV